jgi:hypothetical protein
VIHRLLTVNFLTSRPTWSPKMNLRPPPRDPSTLTNYVSGFGPVGDSERTDYLSDCDVPLNRGGTQ